MNVNHGGDPTQPPSSPPPHVLNPLPETPTGAQSVGTLGTVVVVLGILAWIALAVFIGFVISFGACFKQECSSLESGAPVWAGLLALVLLIPSIKALFQGRLTQVHVVVCGIPLALPIVLVVLGGLARLGG